MLLVCPHCKKQYNISDAKIPENVTKARCKYCGEKFSFAEAIQKSMDSGEKDAAATGLKKPRKIAISLSKGGVGKTTTSVNLSAGLALAGYKVLLVDTDTQGQSGFLLGIQPNAGLTEYVTGEVSLDEALVQARDGLWVLAGGKSLAGLKRLIDRKDYGGETTLAEKLAEIDKDFDYVIVDTSPGWDPLIVNVLFYVKEVLTPVSLEVLTLQGLIEFLKSMSAIQKYNKDVALKYILPTFLDKRVKHSDSVLQKLEALYGDHVCNPIRYNARLSEAPAYNQTIFEFAPGSQGAQDYRELVRKVANNPELFK